MCNSDSKQRVSHVLRRWALFSAASLLLVAGSLRLADYFAGRPTAGIMAEVPRALVPIVACAELAVAVCLFNSGWGGIDLQRATGVLYLAFATAALWTLLSGSPSCACFGIVQVPPAVTLGVDLALAFTMLVLPARRLEERPEGSACHAVRRRRVAGYAASILLPLVASATLVLFGINGSLVRGAIQMASVWDQKAVRLLTPKDWLGQSFPLAREAGLTAENARGQWTLLFYHRGCPKCEATLC